jgi:transposase
VSKIKVLGIDLAKSVFQLHGVDERGVAMLRKQLRRAQLLRFVAQIPACIVAMEACGGAHHWARQFEKLGHTVRLIPPQYVKPFVKGNKTDRNDAEAICEATVRPNMRFVPVKSLEQQSSIAAQRLRSLLVKQRTALVNHVRGELAEFGVSAPKGIAQVRALLREDPWLHELPGLMREVAAQLHEQLQQLDEAIGQAHRRIEHVARANPTCRHLMQRRGIGILTASALAAHIDPVYFKNGRHLSAFIGLVPKEHSSGGKQVRMGISKRGNTELRTLLIHGARAVVRTAASKRDPLSLWIVDLIARRGKHKAIVAVANKMARYAWVDLIQARQLNCAA